MFVKSRQTSIFFDVCKNAPNIQISRIFKISCQTSKFQKVEKVEKNEILRNSANEMQIKNAD